MAPIKRKSTNGSRPAKRGRYSTPSVRTGGNARGGHWASIRNGVQDVVANAVTGYLNTLAPGAGLAIDAARAAHRMGYGRRSSRPPPYTPRTPSGPSGSQRLAVVPRRNFSRTNGVYAGKLRRARRNKPDPYVTKGFKHVVETSGIVTDPDCVYVGHSAYVPKLALEMIQQVILRRLFEKAGLTVTSLADQPFATSANTTVGWLLRLETISAGGSITAFDYTVPVSASILSIVGSVSDGTAGSWPTLANVFIDCGTGTYGAANSTTELLQIRLFQNVVGTSNTDLYNSVCTLMLRDLMVNFSASSDIKIQNRTVSASGSEDAEAVSANPLYCKKFLFNGVPRQRDKTQMFGLPPSLTGIVTLGASGAGNLYMKEPVSPKLFWNCFKNSMDMLQPGSIKSDKIKVYKNMRLLRFLKWIGLLIDAGALTNSIKGPFMLYALEDVINVNLSQLISIAYECNRSMGMFVYSRPRKFATGGVYQNVQDSEYIP